MSSLSSSFPRSHPRATLVSVFTLRPNTHTFTALLVVPFDWPSANYSITSFWFPRSPLVPHLDYLDYLVLQWLGSSFILAFLFFFFFFWLRFTGPR